MMVTLQDIPVGMVVVQGAERRGRTWRVRVWRESRREPAGGRRHHRALQCHCVSFGYYGGTGVVKVVSTDVVATELLVPHVTTSSVEAVRKDQQEL